MKSSLLLLFVCMLISMQTVTAQRPYRPHPNLKTVSYHYIEQTYSYRCRMEIQRQKWTDDEKEMYFFTGYSFQGFNKDFPFPRIVSAVTIGKDSLFLRFRDTNCFSPGYWYSKIPITSINIGDTIHFEKNAERRLYLRKVVVNDIKHNFYSSSLSHYQFQVLGRENNLIYTLNYIHGLGLTQITSSHRSYRLTHINHIPIDQFVNKFDQKILNSLKLLGQVKPQVSSQP